jgi:cardiolipin synthase
LLQLASIWAYISVGAYLLYTLIIAAVIVVVITDDKPPVKSLAWVMVLVFLPVAGLVFYLIFGQNYRKKKLFSRKGLEDFRQIERLRQDQLEYLENPDTINEKPAYKKLHIMKLLLNNSKSILSRNNTVTFLNNGTEKFPELIKELQKARHHIHIEYYRFEYDTLGREIAAILAAKAREGVEVRLILDHVGSWHFKKKPIGELKEAGVRVEHFMPVNFPLLTSKINYRNHRKIVVIDGETGFVGGMNIADKYIHGTKKLGAWRDVHLKLEGDAVQSLQTVFLTDWFFLTNQLPSSEAYFPASKHIGNTITQIVASGPDSLWAGIMQTYFSIIATARRHLYITTPYLLPNSAILTALKTAALAGVDVRLIIPPKGDSQIVYHASLSYIKGLLEAGVKVYFYNKGFIHSKVTLVDGILASVGTANLDYRSFLLNFEINALLYDAPATEKLTESFLEDLENSTQITYDSWSQRSRIEVLKSSVARLFSPLL